MSPTYPYQFYEMAHAALAPARAMSDATHLIFSNPWNPLSNTPLGKNISASTELFERLTRRYGKPAFRLDDFHVNGARLSDPRGGRLDPAVLQSSPFRAA